MTTALAPDVGEVAPARLAAGRIPDPPYPGIRPFEEHEWPIFFGRQAIVEELLERLSKPRFVAVVGASGGGKSSLIKAGLFATLKHKHKRLGIRWRTATMRPAGSPMWSLAEALYRTLETEPVAPDQAAPVETVEPYRASLARGRHALAATLRDHEFPPDQNLLLLVDQFEELFRYDILGGEAEVRTFLDQLVDVVEEPPEGFYLALTMRSEFLGDCARFPRFADALNRASYLLRRMHESELEEAIVRPAELLGGQIAPDLLQRLLRDAQGEQDHLPLLQHALMWLWARERQQLAEAGTPDAPVVLDFADYQSVGGMAGALSQHANAIYEGLGKTQQRGPALQLATQRLFQALAEIGEHGQVIRRPLRFAHLQAETGVPGADLIEAIDAFRAPGRSFLMPAHGKPIDDASVVDVGHEALIRQWDKLGGDAGWLQKERADAETWWRLCVRTRAFMQNRRRLLDREETEELEAFWTRRQPSKAWLLRYSAAPDGAPDRLKERAATEAEQAPELIRRSRRWARLVKVAAGIFGLSMLSALLIGLWLSAQWLASERALRQEQALRAEAVQASENARAASELALQRLAELQKAQTARDSAERQASAAQETAAVERARLLAKQALEAVAREGPTTALLLALEGLAGRPGLPYVPQAEAAAYAALAQLREEHRFVGNPSEIILAWSADGQRFASTTEDGTVRLWTADGAGEPVILRGHEGQVSSAAFSSGGTRVVTTSWDGTARVWNAASGQELQFLRHEGEVSAAAFSPDGTQIVGALDQTVRVWDAASGQELLVLRGHEGAVWAAAFSPDGARIVSGADDRTVRVWDAASGAELLVLRGHESGVLAVAFSPDGGRIVSGGAEDRTVRVWDAASGAELLVLRGHEGPVFAAGFSPDGQRIVSASGDRTARIWAADGAGEPAVLRGHEADVYRAAFSGDGTRVITGSADATARVWRVRPPLARISLGSPSPGFSRGLQEQTTDTGKAGGAPAGETAEPSPGLAFSASGGLLAHERVAPLRPTRMLPPESALWQVAEQRPIWQRPADGIPLAVRVVDGEAIALIDTGTALLLRDGESEQQLPLGSPARPLAAAIAPDGHRLALIDAFGSLSIVDGVPHSMAIAARRVDLPSGTRWTLAFTSDGLNLLGVADDRQVFAIDAALDNLRLVRMEGPEQGNRVLAIDADNGRVAVEFRTADGASLWLKGTSGEAPVLLANARGGAGFAGAGFGPDGGRLVAVPRSGPCLLFDLAHPEAPIAQLGADADRWEAVAYAPSGDRIAAAQADGRVLIWPVLPTTAALIAFARQELPKVGAHETVALSRPQSCAYRLAPEGECGQTAAK